MWSHEPTRIRVCAQDGIVDPRAFSPANNFGAGALARTLVETDRNYSDVNVTWQQEVYDLARDVIQRVGARRVVDIGTGSGAKFVSAFAGMDLIRIQVDWDDRREVVVPNGSPETSRFVTANLEDPGDLERLASELADGPATVFVLSDVIEHLIDVRPVLRILRRLLRAHERHRLIISTPDRDRVDGYGASRLPDNLGHVRQWNAAEFGLALNSAGFDVVRIGHLAQNNFDGLDRTIAAELRCTTEGYSAFLSQHGFPKLNDHLAITTEHADANATGGIGSYYRYSDAELDRARIYLFAGGHGLPQDWLPFVRRKGWMHVAEFNNQIREDLATVSAHSPEAVLEATLQIVFFYDDLKLIEYQDYLGLGARVAQAKRTGLLPPTISVIAYAHGSHFYLDNASGALLDVPRDGQVDVRERISLEQADVVLFPSRFLRDLYLSTQGLQPRQVVEQAYPMRLRDGPISEALLGPIDTLLFYGKQTPQKGYPEFCDAVVELFSDKRFSDVAEQIRQIVLMGVPQPDERLLALENVRIVHGQYTLDAALSCLRSHAPRALAVLPYKADNHPLSIFEVVDADCQLLAFAAGGLPEIIPEELHTDLLCAPKAKPLAEAIARQLQRTFWERARLIERTRSLIREHYETVRETFRDVVDGLRKTSLNPRPARGAVSVVVPNLNGDAHFFDDLAVGLRNSFLQPAIVEVVDDGSDEAGRSRLEASLTKFGPLRYNLTYNPTNLGLAGARNAGLARVRTPYVCAHDNDNILLNRYLDLACRVLDENPDVAAVTAWSWCFVDGVSWRARRARWDFEYQPLGQDLGLGLNSNCFGDALAVYRTESLRALGGWDDSSKGLWEDWQLFMMMTTAGMKILTIPAPMFLYRLRPGSMLQSYARLPGEARIGRALSPIPPADGVSLIRTAKTFQKQAASAMARVSAVQEKLNYDRQERFRAVAHRSRAHVSFEAQIEAAQNRLNVFRQERFRAVAHRSRAHVSFEAQIEAAQDRLNVFRQERFRAVAHRSRAQVSFEAQIEAAQNRLNFFRQEHFKALAHRCRTQVSYEFQAASIRRDRFLRPVLRLLRKRKEGPMSNANYQEDRRMVEVSGLFDPIWYREQYPDLADWGGDLLDHFMAHGAIEGRSPGPHFSGSYYLEQNPDVRDAGLNPLVHFLRYGADEGRYPEPPITL
ncbi:glycosyltransferase [Enterovirga sp. CN4-39]|uniref:glycosyltransferase n=1 Tax=Enterovirga sp. CN4-39 TaxID=3400910 RepID=UPI003C1289F5